MPACVRTQETSSLSRIVTKNIRSASLRCAIERMDSRGLPSSVWSKLGDVERLAFHPGGEARRGEQVVELHRQLGARLWPDRTFRGRPSRRARTAAFESAERGRPGRGSCPSRHEAVEQLREQDVLAAVDRIGLDAHQREQAPDGGADAVAQQLGVVDDLAWSGASNERSTESGRPALRAGRVDGGIDGFAELGDPRAVLAPLGEAFAPAVGGLLRRARRA